MTASLEIIEMIRERAHVTYEEARAALEQCNDDVVEALIYLEKQGKTNASAGDKMNGFFAKAKKLIKASFQTKFIISKNQETLLNLPVAIVIIVTLLVPPLVILGLLIALFTGCRFRVEKTGCDMKINKTFDDISSYTAKVSEQVKEVINQA